MRTQDCEIFMVPGQTNSGPEHWQTRWEGRLSTARRIEQRNWDQPSREDWVERIVGAIAPCPRPSVAIAHSLGVIALVHAAGRLAGSTLAGMFLVAPIGETTLIETAGIDPAFHPVPRSPLPCPSVVIASRNDPLCPYLEAEELAYAWGSAFVDAGDSGHLNIASGHGPWPEGLMRFAGFLSRLPGKA